MTDPNHVTEDRGFKELFTSYPVETVEVFAPEIIAKRGRPSSTVALQQELPLPDLGVPSKFLDVALLCQWPDGHQAAILLVEHWSEARRVDLIRVLWYYAGLRLRHPTAEIQPVILVTDTSAREVPDSLHDTVEGAAVLDLKVRVVRIGPDDLPRLRGLQTKVAATLMALAISDALEAAVQSVLALAHAPGPLDDVRRFLPLAVLLARLDPNDAERFRTRLLSEDPSMVNFMDEMVNEAKAEGVAKGRIAEIRHLVTRGFLPVDAARAAIRELIASGEIPESIGQDAITQLG